MHSLQTQKVGVLKWGALVRRYIFEELKVPFAGDVAVFYPRFQDPMLPETARAIEAARDSHRTQNGDELALQPVFSVSAGGLVVSYLDERQQQYIKNYGLFVRAKKGYTLDQK